MKKEKEERNEMKPLKRIVFFIEERGEDAEALGLKNRFILVFSTTPKNCYNGYCFGKKHLKEELGGLI